jgi:hypothetical protein
MKWHILLILPLVIIGCGNKQPEKEAKKLLIEIKKLNLNLQGDSGFIVKRDGLPALISASLTDTLEPFWENINDFDTIGKFYRVKSTKIFFLCINCLPKGEKFQSHLLLEIKPNREIVNEELFNGGMYPCCWNNHFEGFRKYGDYFYIKTCGTGSAYCSSYFYLFKKIKPMIEQNYIPEGYYSGMAEQGKNSPIFHSLTSTMEFKRDSVIMHYKFERGIDNADGINKIVKTEKFDVKYFLRNEKWVTMDSLKFEGMIL